MHVEGLSLDTGRVHGPPFQVHLGQLGVRRVVRLLGHRLDGLGAVDGLLRPGDIRQPSDMVSLRARRVRDAARLTAAVPTSAS